MAAVSTAPVITDIKAPFEKVNTETKPVVANKKDEKDEKTESKHKYEFEVAMSCGGCSGAVDRVLKKLPGVSSYDVSLEHKTAVVNTDDVTYLRTLYTIQKTGKLVKSGKADGEVKSVEKVTEEEVLADEKKAETK